MKFNFASIFTPRVHFSLEKGNFSRSGNSAAARDDMGGGQGGCVRSIKVEFDDYMKLTSVVDAVCEQKP